nr:hypothetical protein I308_00614 [Cryptococcus tetragattii IND107]
MKPRRVLMRVENPNFGLRKGGARNIVYRTSISIPVSDPLQNLYTIYFIGVRPLF